MLVAGRETRTAAPVALVDIPAGGSYSLEPHPHREQLLVTLSGCFRTGPAPDATRLAAGDAVFVAPGAAAALCNGGNTSATLLTITGPDIGRFDAAGDAPPDAQPVAVVRRAEVPSQQLGADLGFEGVRSALAVTAARVGSRSLLLGYARFEPDGIHHLHRHRQADELVYVIAGEGCQHLGAQPATLRSGDLLVIEREEWHGFRNRGRVDALILFVYVGAAAPGAEGYELHPVDGQRDLA